MTTPPPRKSPMSRCCQQAAISSAVEATEPSGCKRAAVRDEVRLFLPAAWRTSCQRAPQSPCCARRPTSSARTASHRAQSSRRAAATWAARDRRAMRRSVISVIARPRRTARRAKTAGQVQKSAGQVQIPEPAQQPREVEDVLLRQPSRGGRRNASGAACACRRP